MEENKDISVEHEEKPVEVTEAKTETTECAIELNNISKAYGNHMVLKNVSMHVKKGDIYGFVGPNGSGKTTIIRIITGLIKPTSGDFKIFGVPSTSLKINSARKRTNAIVEAPSIYLDLNAYENIKMQAIIMEANFDDAKIDELLKIVGLGDVDRKKKAVNYSLGMRQRLGIAMCLVNSPEFLILDEPLNGLDPEGIVGIRNLILDLNRTKGITFFISSHILTELNLVANRFGIIKNGELIKEISRDELDNLGTKTTEIKTSDNDKAFEVLSVKYSDYITKSNDVIIVDGSININDIMAELIANSISIVDIKTKETSIEEYYISTAGGNNNA
ncbi:MAG: ATP-binding cassette domain-containing protein [Acholeplasmatales bacterium]|nr:ATP-binding cassette domain-containing protein [Acholeplasmatales bacterium]